MWLEMTATRKILKRMGVDESVLAKVSLQRDGPSNVLVVKFNKDVHNDEVEGLVEDLKSRPVIVRSEKGDTSSVHSSSVSFEASEVMHEVNTDKWGRVYIWVEAPDNHKIPGYRCLKRFGAKLEWTVPKGDESGPANQFCTAFYMRRFTLSAVHKQSLIDNALCLRDGWCIDGPMVAQQLPQSGSAKHRPHAMATLYERTVGAQEGSVRIFLNSDPAKIPEFAVPQASLSGWQCIQKFKGDREEDSLKVTAVISECADVYIGWTE